MPSTFYDNYPPGAANDPNAPYNQPEPEENECEVEIVMNLYKTTTFTSTCGWTVVDEDEEGKYSYIEWDDDAIPQDYKEVVGNPAKLMELASETLAKLKEKPYSELDIYEKRNIDELITNLSGWEEDYVDITRTSK